MRKNSQAIEKTKQVMKERQNREGHTAFSNCDLDSKSINRKDSPQISSMKKKNTRRRMDLRPNDVRGRRSGEAAKGTCKRSLQAVPLDGMVRAHF